MSDTLDSAAVCSIGAGGRIMAQVAQSLYSEAQIHRCTARQWIAISQKCGQKGALWAGHKDGKPQARMEKALADLLAALKR